MSVQYNKIKYSVDLPIISSKDLIIEKIMANRVVIIAGSTGSGKTTQLPKICLEAGFGEQALIGCTQPRRIAALSMAARVAEELDCKEHLVGSKIRFRDNTRDENKIKFMTDGILLAEAQNDPFLSSYEIIIIDEAHERSLNIDFLLGLLKRLVFKRNDLKLIITSATIDTEKFSRAFKKAPVIEIEGRGYPVEVLYRPVNNEEHLTCLDEAVNTVIEIINSGEIGDILVFLPTEQDIRELEILLEKKLRAIFIKGSCVFNERQPVILPLFGRMAASAQQRIFSKRNARKIVLATNIAETSITVPGIKFVIDSGLARISAYNTRAGTTKLPVVPVAKASCEQRKGRCGRVGPGICFRLFSEEDYQNREQYNLPEIKRANLAEVILKMISLRLGNVKSFPFIDPPLGRAISDGHTQLRELGAITRNNSLTSTGRMMARLPLAPKISRMIIEAARNNALKEVSIIAAVLSIQDPRIRPADKEKLADKIHGEFIDPESDFFTFIKIWNEYRRVKKKITSQAKLRKYCKAGFLSYQRMREWEDIHEQIWTILNEFEKNKKTWNKHSELRFLANAADAGYESVHKAIVSSYLRSIAVKKSKNEYLGAHGKTIFIYPGSGLFNRSGQWIITADLVETSKLFGRTVANIKPEWIEPLAIDFCKKNYRDPHWEKKRGQVIAYEKLTLFGLVIVNERKVNYARIDPVQSRKIFINSALLEGEIRGNYPFLKSNLDLLETMQGLEERFRSRDLVVDDFLLEDYYEQRLGAGVCDRQSLNRFLKRQGSKGLLMTKDDILNKEPEKEKLELFPAFIINNNCKLVLEYCFLPGDVTDGVTVIIPAEIAEQITPAVFDWLVPGLLEEKIKILLKSLPKNIRKQLIPISQTVSYLFSQLSGEHKEQSLYSMLQKKIYSAYGVRIAGNDWKLTQIPEHLKMNFRLVDPSGKKIMESRSFSKLLSSGEGKSLPNFALELIREKYEIDDFDIEGLDLVERQILQKDQNNLVRVVAFSVINAESPDKISLKLVESREESVKINAKGILALYRKQLRESFKLFLKSQIIPGDKWALVEGIGEFKAVNKMLVWFILEEIFETRKGEIPDRKSFDSVIDKINSKGLQRLAMSLVELCRQIFQERRCVIDQLHTQGSRTSGLSRKMIDEYAANLDNLIPPDLFEKGDMSYLKHLPRYLRALSIRIDRAALSPAKDLSKGTRVAVFEKRLADFKLAPGACQANIDLLNEYKTMLDEFKVSVFAQELKTSIPVSEKRLEKKWQELLQF
jgi:ATP-dependent helicase HrpA